MPFRLRSLAFDDNDRIPKKYSGLGENVSPPLAWTDPPTGTQSLAFICDDPDAPGGTWTHWVLYNLSPDVRSLPDTVPPLSSLPNSAKQGVNDFHATGWGGPSPPPGSAHRYFFRLYALDGKMELPPGASAAGLREAMQGHILAEAELVGTFKR